MTKSSLGIQLAPSLLAVAAQALDEALLTSAGGEPLVPFTMIWCEGQLTMDRYVYGTYDDSIEQGMKAVNHAGESASAYAVAWSGFVELEGQRREAIILEVGSRDTTAAVQLAQPYRISRETDGVLFDPELLSIGETQSLLHHDLSAQNRSTHLLGAADSTPSANPGDLTQQPVALLPVALLSLASNLFAEQAYTRVMVGLRCAKNIEACSQVDLSRRVFGAVTSAIADGDLTGLLPSTNVVSLAQLVVDGAAQLGSAVTRGLVIESDARAYFADVQQLLESVLTNGGTEVGPPEGHTLMKLLEHVASAV